MIKNLIARIKYFLKHGKDDYGKRGFTQLMYRGLPILNSETDKNDISWMEVRDEMDGVIRKAIKLWDCEPGNTEKLILSKDGKKLDMRYKINKEFFK